MPPIASAVKIKLTFLFFFFCTMFPIFADLSIMLLVQYWLMGIPEK